MVRLVMILLGVDYFRSRWKSLLAAGLISFLLGLFVFIDALDDALYFPIEPFAVVLLVEGLATLVVASTGVGGQRRLRVAKGLAVVAASLLLLAGQGHGNFVLSMIFATLFLADGLIQIVSAWLVRFRTWRLAVAGGAVEVAVAIFFYQPYPTHYVGTVPYFLGLGLMFAGWNLALLASRVRRMTALPPMPGEPVLPDAIETNTLPSRPFRPVYAGPPSDAEPALTVHVWTPVGSAKTTAQRQPLVDRYIAAVDKNGVISTGHAAMESPEGVYISLYPGVEIDRSPDDFTRLLRATRENDMPGIYQPDYATESAAWCPSTVRVRIRNYAPQQLQNFWDVYRRDATYNLTHRNCSSTVSRALEAALAGVVGRLDDGHGEQQNQGWWLFLRLVATPELWVAAQLRKRAATMAWTPGLTLDYARALSMLADPRPSAWDTLRRKRPRV